MAFPTGQGSKLSISGVPQAVLLYIVPPLEIIFSIPLPELPVFAPL